MTKEVQPTPPSQNSWLSIILKSIVSLVALLWNLATEGLKMMLNTLKDIPPIVIGMMSASLLFWFGITIITNSETIRIIFAVALSLLALGALGLIYLQKMMEYKKAARQEKWERKREEEALKAAQHKALDSKELGRKIVILQQLSELVKNTPTAEPELLEQLNGATKQLFLGVLEEVKKEEMVEERKIIID